MEQFEIDWWTLDYAMMLALKSQQLNDEEKAKIEAFDNWIMDNGYYNYKISGK